MKANSRNIGPKRNFVILELKQLKNPAAKHLWIQLAQDWIALAENLMPQSGQQDDYRPREQVEPFLAA